MRPKWFVWENVPGVFSTNGGDDFKEFIRQIDAIGYHVAWRVLDAQYVRVDGFPRAVPQRRRRVFVVGHTSRWEYPAEVLFEPNCLQRNTPPCRVKGKGFTADVKRSVGMANTVRMRAGCDGGGKGALVSHEKSLTLADAGNDQVLFWNGENVCSTLTGSCSNPLMPDKGKLPCVLTPSGENVADTLDASYYKRVGNRNGNERTVVCLNDQGGSVMQIEQNGNAGTLRENTHGNKQIICWAASGFGQKIKSDTAATISTDHDDRVTGNNAALIQECYYPSQHHAPKKSETVTLTTENCATIRGDSPLIQECHAVAIAENIIGRKVENGGNGIGVQAEFAYTQNTSGVMGVGTNTTVRRLLPVECERLMGFPDNHTRIAWKGKSEEACPDSQRYKACGNSMCVNVMRWLGMRIENVERKMRNEVIH